MSKIKDNKIDNDNVLDFYKEHVFHQSFHSNCSECYKENRMIRAHRKVNNIKHADLLKKYPALNNPLGSNLPTGFRFE